MDRESWVALAVTGRFALAAGEAACWCLAAARVHDDLGWQASVVAVAEDLIPAPWGARPEQRPKQSRELREEILAQPISEGFSCSTFYLQTMP